MNSQIDRPALQALLGHQIGAVSVTDICDLTQTPVGDWVLDRMTLILSDTSRVPARFLHPPKGAAPVPAVLYCHAHGNRYQMGSAEIMEGRPSLQGPYGPDLRARGIAALSIDMPCFADRSYVAESPLAKAGLWSGKPLFGRMLAELSAAFDWLRAAPGIAPDRVGAMGFSMGATHSWWLAAMRPEVAAAAHLCAFADLATLVDLGGHDGHGIYMTVPGLLPVARSGAIAGLIAPRPQLVCVGLQDWSTPRQAFQRGLTDLGAAYRAAGRAEALETFVDPELDHRESPPMRRRVLEFLSRTL